MSNINSTCSDDPTNKRRHIIYRSSNANKYLYITTQNSYIIQLNITTNSPVAGSVHVSQIEAIAMGS